MKKHLWFVLGSVFLIGIVYVLYDPPMNSVDSSSSLLNYSDIFYIFLVNFFLSLFLLVTSMLGIPLFFIPTYIANMGIVGKETEVSPYIFYSTSFLHGLGEIIILSIVFWFTITHISVLYRFFKYKPVKLKHFYVSYTPKIIFILLLISLVNAVVEVVVSNRLYNLFV